jgi:hypothetical protein
MEYCVPRRHSKAQASPYQLNLDEWRNDCRLRYPITNSHTLAAWRETGVYPTTIVLRGFLTGGG